MAASSTMSDEPPCDTNGSGTPVTGRTASTTPMLMNACPQIQVVMPTAISAPNVSGARSATRRPRIAISMNARMTSTAPAMPNSCPTTA